MRPWVSWALLAANVAVWLAMTLTGGSTNPLVLLRFGAKFGPAILVGEYWRLLTTIFLHIGLLHLLLNSYALYILGPEVERFFGSARFLTVYVLAGLVGSGGSYLFESTLAAGASGAIFGLVGALATFYYRNRRLLGPMGQRRLSTLASLVLINLVIGFTVPNLDNWAHLGGLAGGLLAGWALSPQYQVVGSPADGWQVVDRTAKRPAWWIIPVGLALVAALTMGGNWRESAVVAGYRQGPDAQLRVGPWEEAIATWSPVPELETGIGRLAPG
jgi:rhomboid protease GluP